MQRETRTRLTWTALILGVIIAMFLVFEYGLSVGRTIERASTPPAPEVVETKPPTIRELLRLVNEERARVGVKPLKVDSRLNDSAQYKATDMWRRNYFEHEDPKTGRKNGVEKIFELTGAKCVYGSENLHDSFVNEYNTAKDSVDGWISSTAHHNAMISPKYTYTGFGVAGTKVVEHFCQVR